MNVLSLFDGMSCGRIALERANFKVDKYFASEIDKWAIQITQKNYPDTIQLGNVLHFQNWNLPSIDLLLGGSPCQGFSIAGKRLNWDDPRSQLFFKYVEVLHWCKPTWFLYENVIVRNDVRDAISLELGVEPIMINSALVSAQSRSRYYWTNIPNVTQPKDQRILLKDILMSDAMPIVLHNLYGGFREKKNRIFLEKSPTLRTPRGGGHIPSLLLSENAIAYMNREVMDGRNHWDFQHHSDVRDEKSHALVANFYKGVPYNVLRDWDCIRKFHPIECERLQTVPDNYTEGVSNTQRYKMLGNGWTIDVIVHILSFIRS